MMFHLAGSAPVSIHAPVRGATIGDVKLFFEKNCFNPRARAGRDTCGGRKCYSRAIVSIHAPVRGATAPRVRP